MRKDHFSESTTKPLHWCMSHPQFKTNISLVSSSNGLVWSITCSIPYCINVGGKLLSVAQTYLISTTEYGHLNNTCTMMREMIRRLDWNISSHHTYNTSSLWLLPLTGNMSSQIHHTYNTPRTTGLRRMTSEDTSIKTVCVTV